MDTKPTPTETKPRRILVAGDVCLDVVGVPVPPSAPGESATENWRLTGEMRTHFLPGGAMLLAEFIREALAAETTTAVEKNARAQVKEQGLKDAAASEQVKRMVADARRPFEDVVFGPRPLCPDILDGHAKDTPLNTLEFLTVAERLRRQEIVHSLISLAEFPTTAKEGDKSKTLRIEQTHGFSGPPKKGATEAQPTLKFQNAFLGAEPEILVLDDTGNWFRNKPEAHPWPGLVEQQVTPGALALMVYKLHRPLPAAKATSEPESQPQPSRNRPLSPDLCDNRLWDAVKLHHGNNRLVVISVDDLRESGVPISLGLSWERTALDVVWHLLNYPLLAELCDCPRLIIRLGESGAIYWQRYTSTPKKDPPALLHRAWLIYDPRAIEGSYAAGYDRLGSMVGYGAAFTAALVQRLAKADNREFGLLLELPAQSDQTTGKEADIEPCVLGGIRAGLLAIRRLMRQGYGTDLDQPSFPGGALFVRAEKDAPAFACQRVPIIRGALEPDRSYWRLLDQIFTNASEELRCAVELTATGRKLSKPLRADADKLDLQKAVLEPRAACLLSQAPIAEFAGALRTYDRREIEHYRALHALIRDYIRIREPERPLSVAVFGPPGAGKSFGVKQVAKALNEHKPVRPITEHSFNLSQYQTAAELADAFHLVRDDVLQGKIPLVFFDEFDTALGERKLAWLRYFLAPMQDGEFLDRGSAHPIGQAVFVFAGGTCDTYRQFAAHPGMTDPDFKAAKGPDFLSRLRGALDIPSLNFLAPREPRPAAPPNLTQRIAAIPAEVRGPNATPWPALADIALTLLTSPTGPVATPGQPPGTFDPYGPVEAFPCRAAILLRRAGVLNYQLGKKGQALKQADGSLRVRPEVLRAILHLPDFEYGNRSFEALLDMSRLQGARNYTPSLLPPAVNLSLHASPEHFGQLVETGYPFSDQERDALAERIHRAYLAENPVNNDPSALLPWQDLHFPVHYRESNREQADDIPEKLRAVGLWIRKISPDGPKRDPAQAQRLIERHLIPLARFEHDRWVAQKRRQGWTAGPDNTQESKNPSFLLHNCIFRWDDLTPAQQRLDHAAIRAIPGHLAAIDYEIVETGQQTPRPQ